MSGNPMMFRGGLERWGDWLTGGHQWLLMGTGWAPDVNDDTVADLAATEITGPGYSRLALQGAVQENPVVSGYQAVVYGADRPSWAGIGAGIPLTGLVLATTGTPDNKAYLLACWDLSGVVTDGSDLTVLLGPWEWRTIVPLPNGNSWTQKVHAHEAPGP